MSTQSRYPDEQTPKVAALFMLLFALVIILCMAGCSPRIVESVRTEYVYSERVDTTFQKDSVFLKEYVKGDTVRIIEYRDRYKYQYRMIRDTVAVHDTTRVETLKEVKVEKPLSAWKSAKLGAFWWLVAALGVALLWIFRKPIIKIISL